MHDLDIAGAFFGRSRDGANTWSGTGLPAGNATTQYAEAVSSSSNGYVTLQIDGVNVGVHTTYAVKSGDTCIVSVANREPVVIGVVGKGDKVDNLVASTIKATTAIVSQVIAGSVSADTLLAVEAYIQSLKAGDFAADSIEATTANVVKLVAKDAKFDSLSATKAVIGTLEAAKAYIEDLTAKNVTAEKLEAATAYVEDLAAGNVTAEKLAAAAAYIGSLTAEDVTAGQIAAGLATIDTLDATYANVDFANVGVADIGELLAKSGIIGDIVTETGTITGRLVGVTIVGDLIEAGTLKADRLVVKGEDGLYYKLNVGAESVEGEQTDYNSINGSSIQAQSITATKISVSDLVAFGATIGGLVIEDGSLHSHAKRSHDSGVNGFFLGSDGSAGFGGEASYLRYYAETDDLEIKAKSVVIDTSAVALAEDAIMGVEVQYALSSSATAPPSSGWSAKAPAWESGRYMWQRTVTTMADGSERTSAPTCLSGAAGQDGKDGKMLYGACATAANVAAKVASAAGFKLYQGATVAVKFSASNTVTTAITLNVNSTGAKNVYVNGALTSAANRFTWDAGDTVQFVYDGAGYVPLSEGAYVKETASGVEVGKPGAAVKSLVNASGSFDVIDASGNVLSRFAAKLVELGKSASDAVIRLCGGKGEIKTETVDGSSTLTVSADSVATRAASGDKAAYFLARILNGVPTATVCAYYDGTQSVGVLTATPSGVTARGAATFYGSSGQYVGGIKVVTEGTASQVGLDQVVVGNATPSGSQGNARGAAYLYGTGKGYSRLMPLNNADAHNYLNLSAIAGTGTLPAYKALYSNASGTTGTVALSETAANFSMLEIFFKTNDGDMSSVRVWAPNGKVANLSSSRITAAAGAGWTKSKQISISGTTLAYTGYAGESGIGSNAGGTNYVGSILICYVLGWK